MDKFQHGGYLRDIIEQLEKLNDNISTIDKPANAAIRLLQDDPHQWSARPCTTCKAITSILGYDFGCIKYAKDRKEG